MKKLAGWVRSLVLIIALSTSCAFAETVEVQKRFDFKEHTLDFMSGDVFTIKCMKDKIEPVKHWIIIFNDGCTVEFLTDIDDTNSRCWRWVDRAIHGRQI